MSTPGTSSGLVVADAAIMGGSGRLLSVQLIADGTNPATLVLYDSAAASGTAVCKLSIAATGTYADATLPADGVWCNTGIYADIGGTGAACIVTYAKG